MDYQALAELLFPNVTETPESLEERFPVRNTPEGAVITRMAPSPTGFVHLGNLVQGLTSERMAHQSGGVLFLRVEDTDAKREVPGAVEVLINTLKHYGIQFDEGATIDGDNGIYGPYRQRQRAGIYHVYAKQLVLQGEAYPCFCTEEELADTRMLVQSEVMQAYSNCTIASRQKETFTQGMMAETAELLQSKRKAYQMGEISFVDFIETERSDNMMQEEYINSLYNCAASYVELQRCVGITTGITR